MWEIIKIVLYYSFAIAVTIVMVAVIIFSFMALIMAFRHLFKETPRTLTGCLSSVFMGCLGIVVFTIILFVGLAITVFVLNSSESKDYEHLLDHQYDEMSDADYISEEHILVTVKKVGRFKRTRRSTPPSIDLYMKNYNDADFKGSIKVHILLNGESIDQKEFEIDLGVEDFYADVAFPSDFDIGDRSWRDIWGKIEVDYTLDGEFTN